jgi:hypothetical protein
MENSDFSRKFLAKASFHLINKIEAVLEILNKKN